MAEYIDRDILHEQVTKFFNVYGLNDFIDTVPTADVIERSKIDKAISEIKQESYEKDFYGETKTIVDLIDVLEILERNIEREVEQ